MATQCPPTSPYLSSIPLAEEEPRHGPRRWVGMAFTFHYLFWERRLGDDDHSHPHIQGDC